jgi:hypothetical protein
MWRVRSSTPPSNGTKPRALARIMVEAPTALALTFSGWEISLPETPPAREPWRCESYLRHGLATVGIPFEHATRRALCTWARGIHLA